MPWSASDIGAPAPARSRLLARLDVRLVPAALTGWIVTAAGIVWPVGPGAGVLLCRCWSPPRAVAVVARGASDATRLRAIGACLLAVGVVGAGFGLAIALRADAVARHPITAAFGPPLR